MIAGADAKMKSLETQWLGHKTPLVEQIEDLRTQAKGRQATIEQKLSELQGFKQQMKSSSEEARLKDEQLKSLVSSCLLCAVYLSNWELCTLYQPRVVNSC